MNGKTNYLKQLFDNEVGCKRVSAEKLGQFIEHFQILISFNPTMLLNGRVNQSELMLLYHALDFRAECGENLTVAEAARRVDVAMPSVSRTLRSLADKGFVERVSDENDRRSVRISVTEDGEELIHGFIMKLLGLLENAMSEFTNSEIETIIDLYGKFVDAVHNAVISERRNQC